MSNERTNITIQVRTKWEADVIGKWLQLKRGPEAVAEAMGKVGDKSKKAGGIMSTITKGWDSDFKNIIRSVTGIGLAFRALDAVIAGIKYGITTALQQTQAAQTSAYEAVTKAGAAAGPMSWMAGADRVRDQMGMTMPEFLEFLKKQSFGRMAPAEAFTAMQDVFSQAGNVLMDQVVEHFSELMRLNPNMPGQEASALLLALNPLIKPGGVFAGDLKGAVGQISRYVARSPIRDFEKFALSSAAYTSYVSDMGTPEGIARYQKQLDEKYGAGNREARLESLNLAEDILVDAQTVTSDISGRRTAHAALGAAIGFPEVYKNLALRGDYSDAERARAMELSDMPFGAWVEEIQNSQSRLAQDTRYVMAGIAALGAAETRMDPEAKDTDFGQIHATAIKEFQAAGGLDRLEDLVETSQSPEALKYLNKANEQREELELVLESLAGLAVPTPERGELVGRVPVQRKWLETRTEQEREAGAFGSFPKTVEEARAAYVDLNASKETLMGAQAELAAKVEGAIGRFDTSREMDAFAETVNKAYAKLGEAERNVLSPLMLAIERFRLDQSDDTTSALLEQSAIAKEFFASEGQRLADQKPTIQYTPGWSPSMFNTPDAGVPTLTGDWKERRPTSREADTSVYMKEVADALKLYTERLGVIIENQSKTQGRESSGRITLEGKTGARIPAKTKVPTITTPNDSDLVP